MENLHGGNRKKQPKRKKFVDLMEMTPERKSAQDADSLSGLEKLRKQRSAFPHSHRPGGHPQDLTNPRGGPNQMIKSGPDRVDKPTPL